MTGGATTITLTDFLTALHPPDAEGFIDLRALPSKRQTFIRPSDIEAVQRFIITNGDQDVYFGVATRKSSGDGSLINCGELSALFSDIDFKGDVHPNGIPEPEARVNVERFPLKPSLTIQSGGGLQCYWRLREPLNLQDPEDQKRAYSLLRRLALALGGDLAAAEPARILRVPGTLNHRYGPPRRVLIETFELERQYNLCDLDDVLPEEPEPHNGNRRRFTLPDEIAEGDPGRDNMLYRFGRKLKCAGLTEGEITDALIAANQARCRTPLPEEHVREKAHHVATQPDRPEFAANGAGYRQDSAPQAEPSWPTLAPEALHGLAGEIVRAIDPYTEADPVATLAHLLAGFGNIIGSGAHAKVQHSQHPARLKIALVGNTSSGRKGTAWSTPKYLLGQVDEMWARTRITGGLSSGEGLIYHVRDAREEQHAIKESGRVIEYQTVIVDAGEADKRLFVIETEFATVLKRMAGEGNTLSSVIREAWDSGNLSTLTKNSPMRATGAHVTIVAHVTRGELLRYLTETERANGFANRFLWLLVRKSKNLPDGEAVPEQTLVPLAKALRQSADFAKGVESVQRDAEARELWHVVYPELATEKPGMLGAIVSRAEAHVLRLSVLYAMLDCSDVIRAIHLKAALALWDFCEQSARYIFGEATGDADADRIVEALKIRGEMSESDILHGLFQRNVRADRIHAALSLLHRGKLTSSRIEETEGRSKTLWRATT